MRRRPARSGVKIDCRPGSVPWKLSETRECGLVFIGRDVPRDMLKQRFEARRAWENAN